MLAVNKMDLVDWDQDVFEAIRKDFSEFATKLDFIEEEMTHKACLLDSFIAHASANPPAGYSAKRWKARLQAAKTEYTTVGVAGPDRNLLALKFKSETRNLFASQLAFTCSGCDECVELETSQRALGAAAAAGRPRTRLQEAPQEVNLLASYAAMNIGRGASDMFTVAASLDIPLDQQQWLHSYYKSEATYGPVIEKVAARNLDVHTYVEKLKTYIDANPDDRFFKKKDVNGRTLYGAFVSRDA